MTYFWRNRVQFQDDGMINGSYNTIFFYPFVYSLLHIYVVSITFTVLEYIFTLDVISDVMKK